MQIVGTTEKYSSEKRLVRHPACDGNTISDLTVHITIDKSKLRLNYRLQANLKKLCIPLPRSSARTEGLWRHSCFEAFIRGNAGPEYFEYNFSPSGEWAAYQFRGYRQDRVPIDTTSPLDICVNRSTGLLELEAVVSMSDLRVLQGRLQLGLAAVVEASDGSLSFWALDHPAAKPDFHHPASFALPLSMDDMPKD